MLGHDVLTATNEVRSQVGFLPDVPGFYKWMTAPEFLRFAGGLFGLDEPTLRARASRPCSTSPVWPASRPASAPTRGA